MSVRITNWFTGISLALAVVGQSVAAEKITVFAAASLTNVLQEMATDYEKAQKIPVVTSFASTSVLARQIEQGAPADLFIAADQQWMDYAQNKQVIEINTRYTVLRNALVLIAPRAASGLHIEINENTDWKRLLHGARLASGDPAHVPAGIYAKEALTNLGAWATVEPLLAPANNVRAALALVERGETPYGIVYDSDAVVSNKVVVVGRFPAESYRPAVYPMAVVKDHARPAVTAFYQWLKGPEAAVLLKKYGFLPLYDIK